MQAHARPVAPARTGSTPRRIVHLRRRHWRKLSVDEPEFAASPQPAPFVDQGGESAGVRVDEITAVDASSAGLTDVRRLRSCVSFALEKEEAKGRMWKAERKWGMLRWEWAGVENANGDGSGDE